MNKKELRSVFMLVRDRSGEAYRKEASEKICASITALDEYKNSSVILLYNPIKTEVDVSAIAALALSDGKTVLFPRVCGKREMDAVQIQGFSELYKGAFGVMEPSGEAWQGKIDFAVLPALAANRDGYRIGYGKGYYDIFLSSHKVKKTAVAVFSIQLCDEKFFDEYDVAGDITVTENEVYR